MSIWDFVYYLLVGFASILTLIFVFIAFSVSAALEQRDGPTGKPLRFHERIFWMIANNLNFFARLFKVSYFEINIILYYFIIPLTWMILLDVIFGVHYFKIGFVLLALSFFLYCGDFKTFSKQLFHRSVIFLNAFNRFGSTYVITSVWICVFIPIAIYAFLIYLMKY